MEYVGPASEWDEVWWRGDWGEGKFTAWYVKDGDRRGGADGRPLGRPRRRPATC